MTVLNKYLKIMISEKCTVVNLDGLTEEQIAKVEKAISLRDVAYQELKANFDSVNQELADFKGQITVLTEKLDSQQANFDSEVEQKVNEKIELINLLNKIATDTNFDGLSVVQIKQAIVKKQLPDINLDGISEAELNGMLKAIARFADNKKTQEVFIENKRNFDEATNQSFSHPLYSEIQQRQKELDKKFNEAFK